MIELMLSGSGRRCRSVRNTVERKTAARQGMQCDSNDRYGIAGVRPGEYYALAFAGNGPLPVLDRSLLNQASRVTVRAGEVSSADLRAIPQPPY